MHNFLLYVLVTSVPIKNTTIPNSTHTPTLLTFWWYWLRIWEHASSQSFKFDSLYYQFRWENLTSSIFFTKGLKLSLVYVIITEHHLDLSKTTHCNFYKIMVIEGDYDLFAIILYTKSSYVVIWVLTILNFCINKYNYIIRCGKQKHKSKMCESFGVTWHSEMVPNGRKSYFYPLVDFLKILSLPIYPLGQEKNTVLFLCGWKNNMDKTVFLSSE